MINTGLHAGAENILGSKPFQRLRVTLTSQAVETAGSSLTFDSHRLSKPVLMGSFGIEASRLVLARRRALHHKPCGDNRGTHFSAIHR